MTACFDWWHFLCKTEEIWFDTDIGDECEKGGELCEIGDGNINVLEMEGFQRIGDGDGTWNLEAILGSDAEVVVCRSGRKCGLEVGCWYQTHGVFLSNDISILDDLIYVSGKLSEVSGICFESR